jgi:TetR/AcrR family transcriptional repressor of nem operon
MPRHAEFDRDDVVHQATYVFWERGYARTSVSDLVDATGLQPGSLYAAFGNKKGLFLEVIDQYNRGFVGRIRALRDAPGRSIDKLEGLLQQVVEDTARGGAHHGCLTVNALLEMSAHDDDIATRLQGHNARLRKAFAWLVKDAQAEGDVQATRDANELATFVLNNLWGMRVMCKSRPDRASLDAIVEGVLNGLRSNAG